MWRQLVGFIRVTGFACLSACGARTGLEDPCTPSGAEQCDGIDNDCNGAIDDGIAPISCSTLACVTTVVCADGVMPACVPPEPSEETCNLIDDDCDGEIDEGFNFGPLGDVITLRTDEFATGDCNSCSWAFGTTLAPVDGGHLALWELGVSGGSEQANLYGRRLDPLGNPAGPIELLRSDFVLNLVPMPASTPAPPRGFPVDSMLRVGSGDVPGILFVDAAGTTTLASPTPGGSVQNVPRTVWTGSRFISAWEEEEQLRLAVLDANGVLERELEVDPLTRPVAITLSAYRDRVGILVTRFLAEPETRDQWFMQLDALGNVLTPAHPIDVEYANWQRLIGTEQGWLHVRPNSFGEPSTRQLLDVTGEPLESATAFADGRSLTDSGTQDIFLPLPDQQEILTAWQSSDSAIMHVEFLDGRGDTKRGWSGPLPMVGAGQDYLGDPHVALSNDRVLVTWHGGGADSEPNRVYLRAFGCVP